MSTESIETTSTAQRAPASPPGATSGTVPKPLARTAFALVGLALAVHVMFGLQGLLLQCQQWSVVGPLLCNAAHGHFVSYIAFRYALYGAIVGAGLLLMYRQMKESSSAPTVNGSGVGRELLAGIALAYVVSRLVAEGKINQTILGVALARTENPAMFQNSAGLFVIGLVATVGADALLPRLIDLLRKASSSVFGGKG